MIGKIGTVGLGIVLILAVGTPAATATDPGGDGVIAFSRVFALTDADIAAVVPDSLESYALTHNSLTDFDPAWSPDGRKMAFSASGSDVDIWVQTSDGYNAHDITNDPDHPDLGASWSPDGRQIVYWRQNFDGTGSIWVMNADGTGQTQLTDDSVTNATPSWSPDGSRIAFMTNRDGNNELYTMAPDGSDLQRLTTTPDVQEENQDWSPDGSMIAFDSCPAATYPCPGSADYNIFVMAADGSGLTQLTTDTGIDAHPSWSPQGTRIAFRADRPYTAIWMMDADGSNQTQLTFGNFHGGVDPAWQPLARP